MVWKKGIHCHDILGLKALSLMLTFNIASHDDFKYSMRTLFPCQAGLIW